MSSIDWGFIDGLGSSSGGGGANNNNDSDGILLHTGQQVQNLIQQYAPPFVIAAGMDVPATPSATTTNTLAANGNGIASSAAAARRAVVPPPVIERKSPITSRRPPSPTSPQTTQNHKLSIHRLSPTVMEGQDLRRTSSPRGLMKSQLHLPHDMDNSSLPGSDVPAVLTSSNHNNNNNSKSSIVDDQSVISEISERTGAFMDDKTNDDDIHANDAVRALLRGGGGMGEEEIRPTTTTVRYKMNGGSGSGGGTTATPASSTKHTIETPSYIHRQHQRLCSTKKCTTTAATAKKCSSPMDAIKLFLDDVQTKYGTYKATRSSSDQQQQHQQQEEKQGQEEEHQGCSIQSIIENIQFCGWYLCGMDTTLASSPEQQQQQQQGTTTLEKTMLDAKEVRKKEAELTFLGKDIAVCGANTRSSSSTAGIAATTSGGGRGNWCTQL
jgi:hypothetical protein